DVAGDPARAEPDVRQRVAGHDDVVAVHRRGGTVGVDRDGGVGVDLVPERCPPGDAGAPRPDVHVCHHDGRAHVAQDLHDVQADGQGVPRLRVAGVGGGAGRVARLRGAGDAVEDRAVDLGRVQAVADVVAGVDQNDLAGQ